jgi:hypothetical protein
MKKLLLAASAFVLSFSVMAQKADDLIKVNTEKVDFGKIKQGVPVTTYFEIKNVSDKPVVVSNASASCGCTTPDIPKEPIAPNATAKLKVLYNAQAMGGFTKDVYIFLAGVQEPKNVKITGEVLDATAYEAYAKENAKAAKKPTKPGRK